MFFNSTVINSQLNKYYHTLLLLQLCKVFNSFFSSIARARIHVEIAIQRIKLYRINCIPASLRPFAKGGRSGCDLRLEWYRLLYFLPSFPGPKCLRESSPQVII